MPVSIYDIAEKAKVSPSTVSRALQDHPRIGAKTKQRILALAKELDYIPSAVARSLTTNQTSTIGVVVAAISDPFMGRVVEGVEQVAIEAGFNVFLSTSQNDHQRELEVLEALQRRRIDGIMVISSHLFARYSPFVSRLSVPVVVVNEQTPGKSVHAVAVDDLQGARAAVEHLLALGHRRIAYVGTASRPKSNGQRLRGYQAALKAAGVLPEPELVAIADESVGHAEAGEASVERLLAAGASAAFCYNDMTAIGVLAGCYRRGLAVPGAFSVIGFDDIDIAPYTIPPLTTIRQPRYELGRRAMRMMLELLDGKDPLSQFLEGELVLRETTAPPAAASNGMGH